MLGPAASLASGPIGDRWVKHLFSASGYYYAEAIEVALRRLSKHRRLRIFPNRLCCWRHTVGPLKTFRGYRSLTPSAVTQTGRNAQHANQVTGTPPVNQSRANNFIIGDCRMSLMKDLLERPFDQAITSKYTAMNGLIYLGAGTLVLKRIPVILKHSLRERNSWRIRLGLVVG